MRFHNIRDVIQFELSISVDCISNLFTTFKLNDVYVYACFFQKGFTKFVTTNEDLAEQIIIQLKYRYNKKPVVHIHCDHNQSVSRLLNEIGSCGIYAFYTGQDSIILDVEDTGRVKMILESDGIVTIGCKCRTK